MGRLGGVGGLVLNLTPCVLPVIPIKVMTISKHAGSRERTLFLDWLRSAWGMPPRGDAVEG